MANGRVQLNTGAVLEPLNYSVERHFDPKGMAKSLSHLCRFAGNTRVFYSVLQHTLLVSNLATEIYRERRQEGRGQNIDYFQVALMGLLHEAYEQVIGDIPGPLKDIPVMKFIKDIENQNLKDLYEFHGLDTNPEQLSIVSEADKYALAMEADAFMDIGDLVWNSFISKYSPTKYEKYIIIEEDSSNFEKWQSLWLDRYIDLVEKIRRIKEGLV